MGDFSHIAFGTPQSSSEQFGDKCDYPLPAIRANAIAEAALGAAGW